MNTKAKYQCGSCELIFNKLEDNACPNCGSGNWVIGIIDGLDEKINSMFTNEGR